ncbi:MAG: hypothetical protein ACI9T8_000649 [Candidatus Saccharimonadales bacterium]|jgi:hypothetical protein
MSIEINDFKKETIRASGLLCEEVFGYAPGTFIGDIDVVADQKGIAGVPVVERENNSSKLTLSVDGANRWDEIIGRGSREIGLKTSSLYAASGIALLELANVVHYSVANDDPVLRLMKVSKAFNDDSSTQDVCDVLSLHTDVDVRSIVFGLEADDFAVVSRLRYGLGVALKAYGTDVEGVNRFSETNLGEAINSIKRYRLGASGYLSGAIAIGELDPAKTSSREVTEKVLSVEFPYLQVASSMPMNVTELLNKDDV